MEAGKFLTGRVAVVTGAARGIGKTIACALVMAGADVVICDIDELIGKEVATEISKSCGGRAIFIAADLSKTGAAACAIDMAAAQLGGCDILVNNARSSSRCCFTDENEESWDEGVSVMLKAPFFASQRAIGIMKENGWGRIINIGSVLGELVANAAPHYHVAKAGLIQMTRYLAIHAGNFGVTVNSISPGFIVKDENKERYSRDDNASYRERVENCHPGGRVGSSKDVADAVLFLCSDGAGFINGHSLTIDGGLTIQEQSDLVARYLRGR